MKNILFFITAIMFIAGCGSSSPISSSSPSSSLPTLTVEKAKEGAVIMYINISGVEENREQEKKDIAEETGLSIEEFAYSPGFSCESLNYKKLISDTVEGVNGDPTIYFYSTGASQCIEFDYSATEFVGSEGFVILLK